MGISFPVLWGCRDHKTGYCYSGNSMEVLLGQHMAPYVKREYSEILLKMLTYDIPYSVLYGCYIILKGVIPQKTCIPYPHAR